ncbi:MAG: patatin-like phospholipase family protein [Gallionella sp.]|nr:patatin-like phospholipase family protein [Gallionella sp.]
MKRKIGLIMTGGGARAAYQVGVLKAIAEILPRRTRNPFFVICGTSAGSLNAVTLAVNALHFRRGVQQLLRIWQNSRIEDIYRSDPIGVLNNSLRWFFGLLLSGMGARKLTGMSLLDNSPLATFLDETLPCDKIQKCIDAGVLHALGITASGYGSGQSVTFYQGAKGIHPWKRARRLGVPTMIETRHLMASAAIPFVFPAVRINREYFGDGSMRQIAPISSALHLGAHRILVIGGGQNGHEITEHEREHADDYPSLAQIAGHALNSIFLDSMEVDLERLQRINRTLSTMPEASRKMSDLHHVDILVIAPSQPIEKIAERYSAKLPWTIRYLMRLIGAMRHSGSALVSYLLFEKSYCRALVDLGYQDAMKRREEIVAFFSQQDQRQKSSLRFMPASYSPSVHGAASRSQDKRCPLHSRTPQSGSSHAGAPVHARPRNR